MLVNEIRRSYGSGNKLDFLFFWSHHNRTALSSGKFMLSQWYESPFEVNGVTYLTAEHWMMAEKARKFGDSIALNKILNDTSPSHVKAYGRSVHGFDKSVWDKESIGVVVEGNLHKFKSSPSLRDYLVSTGDKILVEASPVDRIWGVGMYETDPLIGNPFHWKGSNLLGAALMQVREAIK